MTEIRYVTGDATVPQGEGMRFIAHVCNNVGGWGRGFVVALSKRSRTPEDCYRRWYRERMYEGAEFRLGEIQRADYTSPDTHVINMIAQDGVRHDPQAPPAISYPALRECLDKLGCMAGYWQEATGMVPDIHMPRIGCGLGGGDWAVVEEAILASLVDVYGLTVTVYDLPRSAA